MESKSNKYSQRFGMALAYAGGSPIFLLISGYLVYFYTNVAGLNAAAVATVLLVSKVLDGFSDIIFGNMIDRTRTKMGVCKPWVVRMSAFGVVGIVSLFFSPNIGDMAKYIYVFVSYNFANTVVATIYQLAIISLPSYLTRDSKERNIIYIFANTGQTIMQVLISFNMFKVITALGGGQSAWLITTVVISVSAMIITLIGMLLCKETVNPDEIAAAAGDAANVPFVTALKSVLANKYWWMILIFVTLGSGVYSGTATMTPYFAQYILGDTTIADTLNSCFTFPMMFVTPLLAFIVSKVGKRNIALTGAILISIGCLITCFTSNLTLLCVAAVLKSVGVGCPTAVYAAMLADAIEYGQWKTGVRNQAVLMGAQSAGGKIGAGVISAILSYGMAFAGYDGMAAVQSESALASISALYSILPLILGVGMVVILFMYDLDKRFPQIMAELAEREGRK